MTDKDYAPLSAACVRALHDKLYDKRKLAALEIEKMVKEFHQFNNTMQINRLLKVLGQDFAASANPHAKKGGLIGLAAVSIALGKESSQYIEDLIKPILACFSDADLRVRYYACESLYNVIKVARGSVLPYLSVIFKKLSIIATDPEQSVKNASELLDRLMKDIVTESCAFDLEGFMPCIREKLYAKSHTTFSRQFIISWISVLDAVPDIDLIVYLPELLDGLFTILDDPNQEVQKMCETVLGEFMRNIKSDPSRADFASMINILIIHAQEKGDYSVQFTAITWIKEFVQLSGPLMLPYMSGIFKAVLPCLSYDSDARRNIKETATAVNFTLMKLITLKDEQNDGRHASQDGVVCKLDLEKVLDVLTQYLSYNSVQTKVAVLRWIHHLYTNLEEEMDSHVIDLLFPALTRTLSDSADEVVQQCLIVIADIIKIKESDKTGEVTYSNIANSNVYASQFLRDLARTFKYDKTLLEERGSFIIRQLCVLHNAEFIYWQLSQIICDEENLKFTSLMVEHLNMILMTSSELYEMRNKLKNLNDRMSRSLFESLYELWCHNPVATISFCLLAQCYNHVCDLIKQLGNMDITVSNLTAIDKLVQLLESPIFAYLRLELLDVPCDRNLVRALYGLLMLLPQTDAFHTLRTRLSCIPSLHLHCDNQSQTEIRSVPTRMSDINFEKLLKQFIETQQRHELYKKAQRAKEIVALDKEMSNSEV
ncbi:protein VAC14 homolog isoform X2 [Atheta coriaria]|uniref:protein VAC14 homolog isoform X2 n=1 Tax=Dalotia coriaria TaxID=877792 RepID=UPI0031F3C7BD